MTDQAAGHAQRTWPVVAWSLWDWGSAAFNAVIVTFIFSVYLTDAVGADLPGPLTASTWLAIAIAASSLVLALLAPVVGQRSDAGGHRKRSLALSTSAVVMITAALFFVEDDYHYLWLGLLLIAAGEVFFELAQVPYFAMLRQVSTPQTVGRVSGIGWAFGYIGGIFLLLICFFGFVSGDGGRLGLPTEDSLNIRLIAVLAALWFAVFALPLFFAVPELPSATRSNQTSFLGSYRQLFVDLLQMWRTERPALIFLGASALFRDGLAGVFTFGAVIAVSVYGFEADKVIVFGVVANVVAAAGAVIAGAIDDRVGPRAVIVFSLLAMIGSGVMLLCGSGRTTFWVFGLALCAFVGPAQSASRTYLLRLTPVGKEGQIFGLYAMTGRAVSFLSPALFALTAFAGGSDRWGILGIMAVLAVGLITLFLVPAQVADRTLDSHGTDSQK